MSLLLDLRHYETIVAIVELGTMTAAAKELNSTQSTLSHRVAEAERRLGVQLFDRGRQRRLTPTPAGVATHQVAARALAALERNERILLAERDDITSIVRIAVGSYDCFHWYPAFLTESNDRDPGVALELVVVGDAPGDYLTAGEVDLVLAPGSPSGSVELTPAFVDELVLVVAADHPLATRSSVEPNDLLAENYLTYNSAPTPGFEYDRFVRPTDDYPRFVRVVTQTSAITELVAAGFGVSILSRWALQPAISSGRIVDVRCGEEGLALEWSLTTRPGEPTDSPTRLVAEHLGAHLRSVHEER